MTTFPKLRKPGIVSRLNTLSAEQRSTLIGWLSLPTAEGFGIRYDSILKMLEEHMGIRISRSALCQWWGRQRREKGLNLPKRVRRSHLERLSEEQKQILAIWMTSGGRFGHGLTYAEIKERLLSQFSIRASSGALSHFYRRITNPNTIKVGLVPARS
jgi:transposase